MNSSEILEILRQYKNKNSEKYGIKNLGLFGSFAKNTSKDDSDVDIVIETREPDIFQLVHIKEELELLLNRSVDLVRYRKTMNPYLKKHIEKDAQYV
ncbi:MAG TPA: nucleotidyltransferase family protein [bacterium]|nr:nucleotidyltransferase family protein [bacterium]HPN44023.1 nucleotidyltransferase family protein [bacterium]